MPSPDYNLVLDCRIHAIMPCPQWFTDALLTMKMVLPCPSVLCRLNKFECGQILCHRLVSHGLVGVVRHLMSIVGGIMVVLGASGSTLIGSWI